MRKLLIAAVMLLTFSVAASAQALFQVGSTPVTTVASCGATEKTGDVVFTTVAGSQPIVNGTITINYSSVAISSVADLAITVNGATATEVANISGLGELAVGQLVLAINPVAGGQLSALPVTIRVSGVRVNIAGTPGLTSLSAQVTATNNAFVGGQTSVLVISSIASAIESVAVTGGLTNVSAVNPLGGTPTVKVTEGFLNAFAPSNNAAQGPIIALTFAGIPAGATLTFPAIVSSNDGATVPVAISTFTLVNATGGTATPAPTSSLTSTSSPATVYYRLTTVGATSPTVKEILAIPVTVAFAGTPRPIAQGSITVSGDMAPKTTSFTPASFTVYVPQFSGTSCQKAAATPLVTVVGANTVLLIPYAVNQPTNGFNTGIAIANTTTDPFTGTASAAKQNGTITFSFFPQTGTAPAPYTTSSTTPGEGLNNGVLETGRLYTVLLSQLLEAAGVTGDFSGYIFIQCSFTNAHGQYFISDFEAFTNGALMLVVNNAAGVRQTAPESLGN